MNQAKHDLRHILMATARTRPLTRLEESIFEFLELGAEMQRWIKSESASLPERGQADLHAIGQWVTATTEVLVERTLEVSVERHSALAARTYADQITATRRADLLADQVSHSIRDAHTAANQLVRGNIKALFGARLPGHPNCKKLGELK